MKIIRNKKGSLADGAYSFVIVLLMLISYLAMVLVVPSLEAKSMIKVVAEGELISFLESNQYYLDTEGELTEGEYVQEQKVGPVSVKIQSMVQPTEIAGLTVYSVEYALTAKMKTAKPVYLAGSTVMTATAGVYKNDTEW